MIPITHQKARAFLQAAADQALKSDEQIALDAHLAECGECRTYAQNLDELQNNLGRVIQERWITQAARLPIQTIKTRSRKLAYKNKITGIIGKMVVAPLMLLAFVIVIQMFGPHQIGINTADALSRTPTTSLSIPTPPYRTTVTTAPTQTCKTVIYVVQENDTLASIAAAYAVPQEAIKAYNGLASNSIRKSVELVIPLCDHASQGITATPSTTITIIPLYGTFFPSPRG